MIDIDIIKAKKAFKEYVKNYNPEDERVKLKIAHIERVSQIAKKIAEGLNLNEEDVALAELIGLLHDIGRFEQIKRYQTFEDLKSINHGEYGAEILFENGLIRKFIDTDKFDKIIRLAVINHNRSVVQEDLSERELLHAKIIRDADKIDIFYVLLIEKPEIVWESKDLLNDTITDEIYREFLEDKKIDYKKRKTGADILVSHFAYIYDINFKQSFKIIDEKNYLEKLYKRNEFKNEQTRKRIEVVYKEAKKYLEKKEN